jgi:predicted Zn-dependent protease
MNIRWLARSVILGALFAAPPILLWAQTPELNATHADAVASQHLGCALGRFNGFYLHRQVAVGRSLAQQIESKVKFVSDPVVTEYVKRIGQDIVRNSDAQVPFTIKVIDSDAVNAVALPDGSFYVSSGLLLAVDEEAEVAAVMAHEIAHVAACHAAREWSAAEKVEIMPSIPIVLPPGGIDNMAGMGGLVRFTRGLEAEADYLGIEYMYRAGYDPAAMVLFFDKIHAMENVPWRSGVLAKSFETHAQDADRVEKSQKEIRSILPVRQQYVVTNLEFDDVKARLVAIENKRNRPDGKVSANRACGAPRRNIGTTPRRTNLEK